MVNFEEIFERIKKATNTRTQVELAEVLDIRQSSISDAKRRNSVPSDWVIKLFDQFGLSPDWIKKGVGPMYLRTDQGGYTPVDGPSAHVVSEEAGRYGSAAGKSQIVPVYATAEAPEEGKMPAPMGRLSIPQSFFCPGLYVVSIASSAMEPIIRKDAFVGIDTLNRGVNSGELYAARVPYEGLVVKRAFIDTQAKQLVLRSENPAHPELSLPLDGHGDVIVGKVEWVLQRL